MKFYFFYFVLASIIAGVFYFLRVFRKNPPIVIAHFNPAKTKEEKKKIWDSLV
jgi:hypothetical protein